MMECLRAIFFFSQTLTHCMSSLCFSLRYASTGCLCLTIIMQWSGFAFAYLYLAFFSISMTSPCQTMFISEILSGCMWSTSFKSQVVVSLQNSLPNRSVLTSAFLAFIYIFFFWGGNLSCVCLCKGVMAGCEVIANLWRRIKCRTSVYWQTVDGWLDVVGEVNSPYIRHGWDTMTAVVTRRAAVGTSKKTVSWRVVMAEQNETWEY